MVVVRIVLEADPALRAQAEAVGAAQGRGGRGEHEGVVHGGPEVHVVVAHHEVRAVAHAQLVDPVIEVRPARSQVDDVLGEIRETAQKGYRTLCTVLTKRMAEDLTEYLHENGVRVRYMHSDIDTIERIEILRDLRLGAFDVLVSGVGTGGTTRFWSLAGVRERSACSRNTGRLPNRPRRG